MKKRTWIAGGVVVASVAMAALLANQSLDSTAFVVLALVAHVVVAVVGLRLLRRRRAEKARRTPSHAADTPQQEARTQPRDAVG
ncbi:hypothetical protein [Streptomyces bohaiensis]|uniref:Uncharacterized protein n=1 Tax=Streptomyces bohaiensis TaxID=1431344 RepID=A0ABX1C8Q1_9ACTN|nr:hypothetical protein [Streptomyces bohaiensis]NJQ15526.1 hypothetical protein [Streptomyces bohaiensis]